MTKRFKPPTIEECKAYAAEKGYKYVDGESFFMFYASKGWMVGRSKMVCWHSAMAGWEARERKKLGIVPKTCAVCKKVGRKYQHDSQKKKIWLCELCLMCINAAGCLGWGKLPKNVIERKVQEGKAKLRH